MTNQQHPITPPPELVQQWLEDGPEHPSIAGYIATQAARWGADQELEACVESLKDKMWIHPEFSDELRTARRPKPSLKEEALVKLEAMERLWEASGNTPSDTIRRALEQLND